MSPLTFPFSGESRGSVPLPSGCGGRGGMVAAGPNPKVFCPRLLQWWIWGVLWPFRAAPAGARGFSPPGPILHSGSSGVRPWHPGHSGTLRGPGSQDNPGVPHFFSARGRASPPKSPSPRILLTASSLRVNLTSLRALSSLEPSPCVYFKSYYLGKKKKIVFNP